MGNFTSTAGASFTPSDAFFLCEAARTGAVDIVRLFLKKNFALVYATNVSDKSTPWHVAAAAGHDVILRVLIDTTRANAVSNNFDPISKVINKQNSKGQTPLMLACGGGHSVCVRLLLESNAHLLVADCTGQSALHHAALHCRADGKGNDCVELILAHMQQQLIAQGPVAAPPAVHANVIRKFADTGDMYGRTALHCAAWSGNTRAAHALWAVGADICARTDADCYDAELPCNNGTTPLHFAAMRGHQPVVVLLLAAWHRMASRPGAPLPRPAFAAAAAAAPRPPRVAAVAFSGRLSERELAPSEAEGKQPGQEPREAGAAGDGLQGPRGQDAVPVQQQGQGREQEASANKEQQQDKQADKEKDGDEPADRDRAARDTDQGGAGVDGAKGREGTADNGVSEGAAHATEGAVEGAAAATVGAAEEQQGGSAQSSLGGSGSRRSSGSEMAPLLEMPPPPSPRPPPMDPRLMMDAYGMTPYTIAGKRTPERGSMLLELLDPATDFGAGGSADEESADDEEDEGNNGDDAATRRQARRAAGRSRGRRGASGADAADDDDSDDDADSEAAAAGPLLLWEGVELVRGIATDPECFFRLQQTVSLLQPQQQDDERAAGGAGSGRRGDRRSSSGGGGVSRPPLATSTTTGIVPDCFLCPLTCKAFRDPVVAADGVTYEREAIERHLRHVSTSPVTKQRLPNKQLYDNKILRSVLEQWSRGLLPPPPGASAGPSGGGGSGEGRRRGSTGLIGRP